MVEKGLFNVNIRPYNKSTKRKIRFKWLCIRGLFEATNDKIDTKMREYGVIAQTLVRFHSKKNLGDLKILNTLQNMTSFTRHYKDKKLVEVSMEEIDSLITDSNNKTIIAEYVYERLYNRFLKIFDYVDSKTAIYDKHGEKVQRNIFNEEYKNGFLIMTSCSLLIETFASFLVGQNMTPKNKNIDMFKVVFEYAEIKNNELKIFKNMPFYGNIRCGLLHQGETYGKFKITRKGTNIYENMTVNAYLFFINLKSLLSNYKDDLIVGDWDSAEWDACRLKIRHIVRNSI